MENAIQDKIFLKLPVKINYKVLEESLREKFIGEFISTENKKGEESRYAVIRDISLGRSLLEEFDLALDIQFRTLTSVFKNKEGSILLHLSLNFDKEKQEITVKEYKLKGNSNSWLLDTSLQAITNKFIYHKIKDKMRFDFTPHIRNQLKEVNKKLEGHLEAAPGIGINGYLDQFRIADIIPGENLLLISVEIEGFAIIELQKLDF